MASITKFVSLKLVCNFLLFLPCVNINHELQMLLGGDTLPLLPNREGLALPGLNASKRPQWKFMPWETTQPTKRPLVLYYRKIRNPLECLQSLFHAPLYAKVDEGARIVKNRCVGRDKIFTGSAGMGEVKPQNTWVYKGSAMRQAVDRL
jgi:hypothetical protein